MCTESKQRWELLQTDSAVRVVELNYGRGWADMIWPRMQPTIIQRVVSWGVQLPGVAVAMLGEGSVVSF